MTESRKSDHWNSLANEVGAEVPPPPETSDETTLKTAETAMATDNTTEEPLASLDEPDAERANERPDDSVVEPSANAEDDQRTKSTRHEDGALVESREPTKPANPVADKVAAPPVRRSHWNELAAGLGLEVSAEEPQLPSEAPLESVPNAQTDSEINALDIGEFSDPDSIGWTDDDDRDQESLGVVGKREASDAPATVEKEPEDRARDAEHAEDDETASRPRRRRRGRRRRKPDGDEAVELPPTDGEADAKNEESVAGDQKPKSEDDEQRPRRPRRRRRRAPRSETKDKAPDASQDAEPRADDVGSLESDDQPDASNEDSREIGEDKSPTAAKKHKKIPTWEDAIGVVVAANMEARSKADSSGGRRGRGRGRSRS